MTLQYLNSISEPPIVFGDQPEVGMSDEEELRRVGLDGIGEEVLVDLIDLGLIEND